jgi:hypothetical protein
MLATMIGLSTSFRSALTTPVTVPQGTACMIEYRTVVYVIPGDPMPRRELVRDSGILDRLRTLSQRLAKQFHWAESQATTFILTGHTPAIVPLTVRQQSQFQFPAHHRIQIDVDPTTPPNFITQAYKNARKAINQGRHLRTLSLEHLKLVEWTAGRPKDESWEVRLKAWNKSHRGKERYSTENAFKRGVTTASTRLLGSLAAKERGQ